MWPLAIEHPLSCQGILIISSKALSSRVFRMIDTSSLACGYCPSVREEHLEAEIDIRVQDPESLVEASYVRPTLPSNPAERRSLADDPRPQPIDACYVVSEKTVESHLPESEEGCAISNGDPQKVVWVPGVDPSASGPG